MHFLLLNHFFAPDPAPTGQLLANVADALAREGHTVTVLCARTSYDGSTLASDAELPGVTVRRLAAPAFGHRHVARLSSYAVFYAGALVRVLFTGPRPDAIVTLTTPPLLALAGTAAKMLRGCRHYIWEMDVYPDVVTSLSLISRGGIIDRAIGLLADLYHSRADGIIVLGESMRARLLERKAPKRVIRVAENWSDGQTIRPHRFPEPQPLAVLYSGNLGRAHDLDTIGQAMVQLRSDLRFRFEFAGGGSGRPHLERLCQTHAVSNVFFTGYRSVDGFGASLGACHIGLVTQRSETLGCVVPSKTYAIMAAGRPVLYIGPRQGTPAQIISRFRCGWQVDPGDTATLVALLGHLADNPGLVCEAGSQAREAFLQNYDLPRGVARVCAVLGVTRSRPKLKVKRVAV